ncbi:EAL domain-containing response regulator [Echinimonas agarilytica]|nr:EAL domain-containing protein [Echinimonas agarilytica]
MFAPNPDKKPVDERKRASWRILVVDDDDEVHKVTLLALNNQTILERHLEFEHAYSAKEARDKLMQHDDFAVILLDVVMESDNAGLELVHYIRNQLAMSAPRIILRTGQPGYAPEQTVIHEYDINDYRTKTEITQDRLITSLTTAIRSYRQINLLDKSLSGMEMAIRRAASNHSNLGFSQFAQYSLEHLSQIMGAQADALFVVQWGLPEVVAGLGNFDNKTLLDQLPDEHQHEVLQCLFDGVVISQDNHLCISINSCSLPSVLFLKMPTPISRPDRHLIQSYCQHIRIAYENIVLLKQLHHTAFVDEVTQLGNRNQMLERLDNLCEEQAPDITFALIDIDHFSDINGSLGQQFGDDTLRAFAMRLEAEMGGGDLFYARIHADVFGIVGPSQLISAKRLLDLFIKPLSVGTHFLPLRIKIGLCRLSEMHHDGLSIMHQCSIALTQAKRNEHLRHAWFESDYETRTKERLDIIRRLRQAVNAGELMLWYQPQMNLQTGKVEALEGLLRWRDSGRFVSPATFIPLAEYSGLINEIGSSVIDTACAQLKQFSEQEIDVRIAINISMQQFRKDDFSHNIHQQMAHHGIDPTKLELEVTESVVMDDPKSVINILEELQSLGVKVAIDDFGTGYSSLSYLKQLPLNAIKIDRAFVCEIEQPEVASIVEMIISLAARLGLTVIAEGIETPSQGVRLKSLGCHLGQGFLIAKPMPIEKIMEYLQSNPNCPFN